MIPPQDELKQYSMLYHDFTRAYTNVRLLTRDFYPEAQRFVESTEPELTKYVEKLDKCYEKRIDYQKLVIYLKHFDEFKVLVNRVLGDLKTALDKGDRFMTRLFELKLALEKKDGEDPNLLYVQLMPELNELVKDLRQIQERAACLEMKMRKLENDWDRAKEKFP